VLGWRRRLLAVLCGLFWVGEDLIDPFCRGAGGAILGLVPLVIICSAWASSPRCSSMPSVACSGVHQHYAAIRAWT